MKPFDIIMFNMSNYSEWEGGVSNRNYHVLKQLLGRPEVGKILAIDYLPLSPKRALRMYKEDLVLNLHEGKVLKRTLTSKLTKMSDKLYVYSDINFFFRPKHTMAKIKKVCLQLNFGDAVLWSFFPFVAPYWHNLGQKLTVFDAVDNWLLHSSYARQKARLQTAYDNIKKSADIIFAVSQNLQNFFDNQPNVYWIPNGVDLVHYNKSFPLVNRDIADISRPIIGYIGVMQERVDFELLRYLAEKNPDKSMVLVGPVWSELDQAKLSLEKLSNVHFLGYKSYAEAPMYIQQFDLGIVPHKTSGHSASTNPMKVYEYLACGKPVVSTENVGLDNFSEVIAVAKDYEDFDKLVNKQLSDDDADHRVARQEFVKKYSWFNTVKKMLDIIITKFD
ncbi:MAG: hypothetical protein C3F02_04675 [Parcubacteria group bacterium]|nr:MAG: hypothetical protein C3F02_04675 [Parcubacteria group bacterium]